MNLKLNQIKPKIYERALYRLEAQVSNEVRTKISNEVRTKISDEVWDEVWTQVWRDIRVKLNNNINDILVK